MNHLGIVAFACLLLLFASVVCVICGTVPNSADEGSRRLNVLSSESDAATDHALAGGWRGRRLTAPGIQYGMPLSLGFLAVSSNLCIQSIGINAEGYLEAWNPRTQQDAGRNRMFETPMPASWTAVAACIVVAISLLLLRIAWLLIS